jgi:molecular chaperone DnaJ
VASDVDYYGRLEVSRDASETDIKKAYKRLAFRYHPDQNAGSKEAEEKFKEIAEAYAVLSDPEKRKLYDTYGADGLRGAGFSPGFASVEEIFSNFGSIFDDLFGFGFGGRRPRGGAQRGADLRYDLQIPFHEAVLGAQREIEINHPAPCETCQGSGAAPGTGKKTCPRCRGTGQQVLRQGLFSIGTTCPVCHGAGQLVDTPCPTCRGTCVTERTRAVTLTIPPGVDDGTRMRLTGEGEPGRKGGPAGDLYVFVRVAEDERFDRDGWDLHTEVELSFLQAVLGSEVEIPLIRGTKTVGVPRGTQPGDTLVLRGEGVPHLRGYGTGDLIVHLKVTLPKQLTREQEELLRRYAEIEGTKVSKKKKGLFSR